MEMMDFSQPKSIASHKFLSGVMTAAKFSITLDSEFSSVNMYERSKWHVKQEEEVVNESSSPPIVDFLPANCEHIAGRIFLWI